MKAGAGLVEAAGDEQPAVGQPERGRQAALVDARVREERQGACGDVLIEVEAFGS